MNQGARKTERTDPPQWAVALLAVAIGIPCVWWLLGGKEQKPEPAAPMASVESIGRSVSAEEFGDKWPFTVSTGTVRCDGECAIFRTTDGAEYGMNGIAKMRGYLSIDPIWKDNPDIPGAKVNVGPMLQLALDQCNR